MVARMIYRETIVQEMENHRDDVIVILQVIRRR